MKIHILAAITLLSVLPITAYAQTSDESQAFKAANDKMMTDMDMKPTGDADKDFIMMMIPHHQGAIDMAKIELQYGKDKQTRALAAKIIKAQEKEIAQMKKWQEQKK